MRLFSLYSRKFSGEIISPFRVVAIVLGAVLLLAAGLKAYQLGRDPPLETDLFTSHYFLLAVVAFETLFGVWLCLGYYPAVTRWVAAVWFTLLLGVSLSQAAAGKSSCACFGLLQIAPWLVAAFDLAAVCALIIVPLAPVGERGRGGGAEILAFTDEMGSSEGAATTPLAPSGERGRGEGAARPVGFRIGVCLFNLIVRLLYGQKLTDEATCYKAFRTSLLRHLDLQARRFDFCPEVTAKLCRLRIPIKEIPIAYSPRPRAAGKKIGWLDALVTIWTLLKWRLVSFKLVPIRQPRFGRLRASLQR